MRVAVVVSALTNAIFIVAAADAALRSVTVAAVSERIIEVAALLIATFAALSKWITLISKSARWM